MRFFFPPGFFAINVNLARKTFSCVARVKELTSYEQGVHAWRRLGRLKQLGQVFFGKRRLASTLPLSVVLLAPLDILGTERESERKDERKRERYKPLI